MKKKSMLSFVLALAILAGLLTGCGASTDAGRAMYKEMAADEMAPMEMSMANGALSEGESGSAPVLPESRKWIVTMHISAETDDLDTLSAALTEKIASLNGYVEDQRVYNGGSYSGRRYRNASMTVRIPADQADSFTQEVAGISNVVSKEKNLEDITLRYVSTESRLAALQTEETRLLELLAQAENMSDLLEIEARLTDVRYELENTASQKRLYDNQIDYATVYLNIDEVKEYTPVEPTVWERISGGFGSSLRGLGEGIVDLVVWIIAKSPYLLLCGIAVTGAAVAVKRARKNRKAKNAQQENKK